MYQSTPYGKTWVSKDGVRWTNWVGRQSYKYLYGGPAKPETTK